jgi:hypothetical protein
MARRKKHVPVATAAAVPPAKPPLPPDVLVDRVLVGGLTALIVARTLVAGDDPGRLRLTSGAGPLILNALTFLLLLGWALGRGWTKRPLAGGRGWVVALGLAITAGILFASAAGPNRYQHPGWYIAWDWVATAALCFLAWQLCTSGAVLRGLVGVLLATAVCLSAQALYQQAAPQFGWPSTQVDPLPAPPASLVGDEEFTPSVNAPRPPIGTFRATFEQPDSFAGFLLLLTPVAIVFAVAGWRAGGRARFVLLPAALVLTSMALAAVVTAEALRSPTWSNAWQGYLGVGPGDRSRWFQLQFHWYDNLFPGRPRWYHSQLQVRSFWVNFVGSAGIAVVVVAATILVVAFLNLRQRTPVNVAADEPPRSGPRWEFYLGGLAGLLLGMMLATGDIPVEASADELLRIGGVAAGRALVWFAAFGLLECVAPDGRALRRALLIGVVLVAVLGFVSDGLFSPALAQPFWIAATLALAVPTARSSNSPSLSRAWAALPLALALLIANLVHVGYPGYLTAASVRSARLASKEFPHKLWQMEGKTGADRIMAVRSADDYLLRNILEPLRTAARNDPDNSALLIELARWGRWHWLFMHELLYDAVAEAEGKRILAASERADQIDPRNPAGKRTTFHSLLFFAERSSTTTKAQLTALEKVIAAIAERSPEQEVTLRRRVVVMLVPKKNNRADLDAWAVKLFTLDGVDAGRHGSMTPYERARLVEMLRGAIERPSQSLAEFLIQR